MENYPKLYISFDDKYLHIDDKKEIEVFLCLNPTTNINITNEALIYSLEDNLFHEMIETKHYISFDSTGISTVCFVYEYNESKLFEEIDFVVYNSFYKDNYIQHFIPEIDRINSETNVPFRVLFDTLFEFYDIINAYSEGIQNVKDPIQTKSKFIKSLFTEKGFAFVDYENEFDSMDLITYKVYKNLLNNLEKILEIRGTHTAYELFFGILGYDIEIFEYWFNHEGNLIETNRTFPELSTFDLYNSFGQKISDDTYVKIDPRYYISPNNEKDVYNKSNFIRVKYYKNINLPDNFKKSKRLINYYLEWLRPRHINYLTEIFQLDAFEEEIDMSFDYELSYFFYEGEEQPPEPPAIERIFVSQTGKLKLKNSVILKEFPITTIGKIIFKNGALISSTVYNFESSEGKINLKGDFAVIDFASSGSKLNFKNSAIYSVINNGFVTTGPLIDWRDYLSQENRDNWEVGYLKGNRSPAEFFAMDFNNSDKSKTYSDDLIITKEISYFEEIKTMPYFDQDGLAWDGFYLDEAIFFLEDVGDESNNLFSKKFNLNDISLLKNNYIIYKEENEQLDNEEESVYEERIKRMILKDFYSDFFIPIEIINILLQ